MAITHVATISAGLGVNGGTTGAFTTTGATLLVASVSCVGTNAITLSDSKGNTWTALTRRTGPSTHSHQIFYVASATVGAGHTVTVSGTGIYASVVVVAFAGAGGFDVQNGATASGGTTTLATGSITPSGNGAVVLTGLCQSGTTVTSLTPTMTQTHVPGSSGVYVAATVGWLVQGTAAAINPSWVWTDTGGGVVAVASFLEASAAAGARVTQDAIEVLSASVVPARVTQDAIEVLSREAAGWLVTVDGVDRTADVVSCSIVWTLNERTRATVVFTDDLPDRLAEIVVYARDGWTPLFGGVILSRHVQGYTQADPDLRISCECGDFLAYADWVTVSASYAAGTLKAVLTALVDDYLSDYGITLNPAQVDGPTLAAISWSQQRVSDGLRELSNQTGYFLSMRPDKVLTMAAPGGTAAPYVWNDTWPTHLQDADWRDLETVPANKVVLTCGPNGLATIADEHHWGDGATRIFVLNSPYVAIVGALRTGSDSGGLDPGGFPVGTYGVDDMPWTYDGDLNAMRQRTDQPILAADEFIMLWYSAQFPFTVEADTGATPVIEYHEARPELLTILAAQQIAEEMLARMSGDPTTLHGRFDEDGYEVGQLLTVDLADMRQIAGTFTIRTITLDMVLDEYWQYSLEAIEGTIAAPSHLVGWRKIIGEGYAIPGPWETPPAVRSGTGTMPSTIITAGVAAALGGPVWLGGTRETGVRTNPADWAPVINYVEYVSGVTFTGLVRADVWTELAGVSSRVRLWNLTDGHAAGISDVVTSQTPVAVLFAVAIEFGKRYRLEVRASQTNAIVRCLGVLEAK